MARDYSKYSNEELIAHIQELEKQLKSNKYGLYWDKSIETDVVAEQCKTAIPVFSRVEDKCIFSDKTNLSDIVIEGDNLPALTTLSMSFAKDGLADVIYIDPPYNTLSNTFSYNDNFVNHFDCYKHSSWLTIMETRLKLAWSLLKRNGTIFISINGIEFAQLKLLCDSIFNEENYVGTLTWESTTQPTNAGKAKFGLQQKCEFILMYTDHKAELKGYCLNSIQSENRYPSLDADGKPCRYEIIEKSSSGTYNRETMKFEILGQKPREGKRWQIGEATAIDLEKRNRVAIIDGIVKKVVYPEDEAISESYEPFWSHFTADEFGTAKAGKAMLKTILGYDAGFDTVKSVDLIKQLLYYTVGDKKDAVVLDFFAGSGTTGQAVLELNQEDNGNRKFILCTNNENDICSNILFPRVKTVITGQRVDGSKYGEGVEANLLYYITEFIEDSQNTDQAKYCLVEKIDELLCVIENTFIKQSRNEYMAHYSSVDKSNNTFIYFDYYDDEKFIEFKCAVNGTEGKKVVYVFSEDNVVDALLFKDTEDTTVKPIPAKIYEIYKEIVEDIKRG